MEPLFPDRGVLLAESRRFSDDARVFRMRGDGSNEKSFPAAGTVEDGRGIVHVP